MEELVLPAKAHVQGGPLRTACGGWGSWALEGGVQAAREDHFSSGGGGSEPGSVHCQAPCLPRVLLGSCTLQSGY